MTDHTDLIHKLSRNARFYDNEAAAFRPAECRNLGPKECRTIAGLLHAAVKAILDGRPHPPEPPPMTIEEVKAEYERELAIENAMPN